MGEVRVALVTLVAHADVAGGVVEAVPLVLAGAGGGPAGAVASRAAKIRARGVPGALHVVVQCVGPYLPVHDQLLVEEVPARAGSGLVEHRLLLRLRHHSRLLDFPARPEAHGGVLERDVDDHVLVAGEPDDQPRRAVAGGVAGEVEPPQLAAGLDVVAMFQELAS